MPRNKSENEAYVVAHKVWMPRDLDPGYSWSKDRGGSRAFLTKIPEGAAAHQFCPLKGNAKPSYVITFQNHKAYVGSTSMRYFNTKQEAEKVWEYLDKGPQIRGVPKGVIFDQLGEPPPRLGIEEVWDGKTFPNGTVGPWDPNPDGTYDDFPTPYDGEADTYC